MPKRKYSVPNDQGTLTTYFKRQRTTMAPLTRRKYVFRRSTLKKRVYKRRPRRFVTARRRRTVTRRYKRKAKSFASKVLAVTTRTEQISSDVATKNTKNPGESLYLCNLPITSFQTHVLIQSRLSSDEVLDVAAKKDYHLKKQVQTHTYMNGSPYIVHATFYYFTVRRDSGVNPAVAYEQGFSQDGNLLFNDANATPFQSSDFCSLCKITKVVKRTLEHGSSYKGYLSHGPMRMSADRRNTINFVKGSKGILAVFVGSLGRDTTVGVTTAPIDILFRVQDSITYQQLSDSQLNNYRDQKLPVGIPASFIGGNPDTSEAVGGIGGNV